MRRSSAIKQALTTTYAKILGPSKDRRAIIFTSSVGGTVNYSPDNSDVNVRGIFLAVGMHPVILDYAVVGDLVQRIWYARGSVALNVEIYEICED